MSLIDNLKWRYATKKMNGQTVPQEKVDYILEAIRLSASSSGLQPYEVFVISNRDLLEKIKVVASGQSQITDASHLIVFAAWDDYSEERIRNVFARGNAERGLPDSATADYINMLLGIFASRTTEENFHHAAKQSYIALGTALAAAAEQQVDSTPMEGFNSAELDVLLNLKEKGLRSTTIMPLGYREVENDWLVNLKKVRTPKEEFITELK
ncbi:nitroreductase family protein [Flavobacterium sp. '19STA2R22 D10 B1']|uniref:nitroreductase family protein n=1 Tax=Flavobacterium aerium TaxID=3037261 RepID=UPI00278C73FF|nr:nitroreductase family protein [Flavobacterium sp. '19STA2R22 D10 B1']